MSFTKVTAAGIGTTGTITYTNVNVAGVITATSATFTGNVSVGGTLTYEDVTNVDSVGLITARSGVSITGGGLVVTGVTTVSVGSTSAPSISPTGDTNTGIFFPSADTIAFGEGGAEAARIDSSGRLLVGTSSARSNFFGTTLSSTTQIEGTGGAAGRGALSVINDDVSNNPPYILLGRSGAATLGSNAAVVSGSRLGTLTFHGADGTSFIEAATVGAEVDGTPGVNDMPGRLVFSTTADGASSPTERMRLDSSGRLGIGTTSPAVLFHLSSASTGTTANSNVIATVRSQASGRDSNIQIGDGTDFAYLGALSGNLYFSTANTERARIDSSGKLLVNTSSTSSTCLADFRSLPGLTGGTTVAFSRGDGGTAADQELGTLLFTNSSGNRAASIAVQTATGWGGAGSADYPGKIIFSTTADGASAPTPCATIDQSGRLLVGTSTAIAALEPSIQTARPSGAFLALGRDDTSITDDETLGAIYFYGNQGSSWSASARIEAKSDAAWGTNDYPSKLVFSTTADGASSPTEQMRVDSAGRVVIGEPANNDALVSIRPRAATPSYNLYCDAIAQYSSLYRFVRFRVTASNTIVGSIESNGSSTTYTTTSDYRLKENVVKVTNAINRLQQLKPSRFNFIDYPNRTVDGFIAHEVQAIVPEAIIGTKDEKDTDGNPIYQGIDQSKLVPLLTAALQEAIGEIESLKARVAVLEAN